MEDSRPATEFLIPAAAVRGLALLFDQSLVIARANRPFPLSSDGSQCDLEGRTLDSLVPPEYRDAISARIRGMIADGGGDIEVPLGTRSSASDWFNMRIAPDGNGMFLAVTGETASHIGMQRKYDLILALSYRISSILDVDELLAEVVRTCKESFGFYNVNIGLIEGKELVIKAGWGGYDGSPDGAYGGEARFDVQGRGIMASVAYTGSPYFAPDVNRDKVFLAFPLLPDVRSEAAVPLRIKDRVVGVLDVESDRIDGISTEDMAVLEAIAGPIAVAVENAGLYVAVKRAARSYHDLFEHAPDIYLTVGRGGFVLDCNRMVSESLGFAKAEIVGSGIWRHFEPDRRGDVRVILDSVLDRGEEVMAADSMMVRRDGSVMEVAISASPITGASDGIGGCMMIIKDVTEKARLERQVMRAQKLDSMGTLAGGIAHDFNNLLGSILGFTSYLKTVVEPGTEVCECLDVIEQTVERGTEITERLQTFARGGEGPRKPVELAALVEGTCELLKRAFEKNITMHRQVRGEIPVILGESGQIQQALMNLCLNARDAMPKGGTLSVSVYVDDLRAATKGRAAPQGNERRAIIEVSDTGEGLTGTEIEKIFEPFYTTKKAGKGMGLGLALVYSIMKRHKGEVTVDSKPGEGSVFRLVFPVPDELPAEEQDETAPARGAAGAPGKATVLLVDDEKNILKFLSMALHRLGYTTLVAGSGQEALRKVLEWKPPVDLVVLDLMMPEMSGEETLAKMKEIRPDLKFVISSAYYSDEKAKELKSMGAGAFLQKPYPVEKLASTLAQVLGSGNAEAREG